VGCSGNSLIPNVSTSDQILIREQEVGVADSVQFQLGGMTMGWENVFDTMCYLHYTRGIPIEGIHR
jgi:hypothetical protein